MDVDNERGLIWSPVPAHHRTPLILPVKLPEVLKRARLPSDMSAFGLICIRFGRVFHFQRFSFVLRELSAMNPA